MSQDYNNYADADLRSLMTDPDRARWARDDSGDAQLSRADRRVLL